MPHELLLLSLPENPLIRDFLAGSLCGAYRLRGLHTKHQEAQSLSYEQFLSSPFSHPLLHQCSVFPHLSVIICYTLCELVQVISETESVELQSGQCLDEAAYNCGEGVDMRLLSGQVCNLIPRSFSSDDDDDDALRVCRTFCERLCMVMSSWHTMLLFIPVSRRSFACQTPHPLSLLPPLMDLVSLTCF